MFVLYCVGPQPQKHLCHFLCHPVQTNKGSVVVVRRYCAEAVHSFADCRLHAIAVYRHQVAASKLGGTADLWDPAALDVVYQSTITIWPKPAVILVGLQAPFDHFCGRAVAILTFQTWLSIFLDISIIINTTGWKKTKERFDCILIYCCWVIHYIVHPSYLFVTTGRNLVTLVSVFILPGCLYLLEHDEAYTFTLPCAYARSILTVPWVELGGKVTINCAKSGYSAVITFQTKPFYGGKLHK